MTQSASALRQIRGRLRGLRVRLRAIVTAIGCSRLVLAILGTLALFCLADYFLDLPIGVRRFIRLGLFDQPAGMAFLTWIALLGASLFLALALTRSRRGWAWVFAFAAGGIVGLTAWFGIRFFQGLRVPLSDEDLALTVEQKYAGLNDRLAASLDFDRELQSPSRGESTEMMQAVVDETVAEVGRLPLGRAVSGRRAGQWVTFALVGCVCAAIAVAAVPDIVGLWFDRSIKLEEKAWPRDTTLVAVVLDENGNPTPWDPARPYEVAHGRPLVVYAQADGEQPDEVVLLDLIEGQSPEPRRMYRVPEVPGIYAYEFPNVRSPFGFVLQGGDDLDEIPRYDVVITVPPRVIDIRTVVTYPGYLGGQTQTLEGGAPTVPQGATVEVRFRTDVPVARAQVLRGGDTQDLEALEVEGQREYRFAFQAEKTHAYRLHLETVEGRTNDNALDSYTVKVRRDRAPKTEWIYPRGAVEVTPAGRVPILTRVSDDYGVAKLSLELRAGSEKTTRYELRRFADRPESVDADAKVLYATDGDYGRRQILAYTALDLPDLRTPEGKMLEAGAKWSVRIVAEDALGQRRESEWTYVDVFAAPELERSLAGRRSAVRSAIETLRGEQRSRYEELRDELKAARDADRDDTVKAVRFAQNKIAQDADQAVRGLIEVFNGFVYDRLGAKSPTEKILRRFDAHHRKTHGLPPAGAEAGPGSPEQDGWVGDPVFPYRLYDEIVDAWKRKVIFGRGLLDRMLGVMEDAVEVAARTAPGAHDALTRALSGKDEDLKAAVAAQKRCLDALEVLLEKMDSWQTLSDMTIRVRALIDDQRALENALGKGEKNK